MNSLNRLLNWLRVNSGYFKPIAVFGLHITVLFLVYKLLIFMSLVTRIGSIEQLKQWDSYWYASIAENGYQYSATEATNSGFFPLFSYTWKVIWKVTGLGVNGICFFNLLLFYLSMVILKRTFGFSWLYFLLFLSIPANMFMFVPYSEAVFGFFSTLIIAGLKKENRAMTLTGLLFASLARPTAVFFIPAIICMEFFAYEKPLKFVKNVALYSAMPLLGLLIVIVFQYFQTGVWFAYFKSQSVMWKRTIQTPDLPFTTWDGPRILWLDGAALFFGLLASGLLLVFLFRKFRRTEIIKNDRAIFFSLCYLVMALLSVIFFNGKDATGGTSLMGANRYIMATPFFIVLLYLISHKIGSEKDVWLTYLVAAVLLFFLIRVEGPWFVNYDDRDKFYFRILIVASVLSYALISKLFKDKFVAAIYLLNVFAMMIILNQFVGGRWIG